MYLSKRPYCTSNTSSFKQNQELIAGNPVPALCRSNAASSPLWLQITSQVRKWDWKWEKSKKLTTLVFMVVTQLFHWCFGLFFFFSCGKQGVLSRCALALCGLWAGKGQLLCRGCMMKGAVGLSVEVLDDCFLWKEARWWEQLRSKSFPWTALLLPLCQLPLEVLPPVAFMYLSAGTR